MKIVYITHYTELYGANKSLLNLLEGMSVIKNIEIHLVVPSMGRITDIAREKNIKFSVIPFYNEIHSGDNREMGLITRGVELMKDCVKFLYNWRTVFKHSSIFRDCDIIHINSTATLIGAYFAYFLGKRLIWHVREFGWEDYRIKYNFGYKYFQYWINKADAVIGISKAIYDKRVVKCHVKQTALIYNGVISKKELQENKQHLLESGHDKKPDGEFVFAIVGHINPGKGQLEALSAFRMLLQKYDNVRLSIVGSGPEEYTRMLVDYIRENNMEEKVTFTGYIEKIETVYTSIDCLLMCSRHEALGRVTIEAMSYGVPVIGYNGGGTMEIIKDGYNGMLYSDGDEELYEKMSLLIQQNNIYSDNALETVENYTIEKCAASVYNIYSNYEVAK
ncbi:Glycosyltransferase involved in cell wall bisynthesis [Chitinophaga sp. YR573]|uniref:glycosyltransferase family 4 protein n=1 Tax=Chitinophaga sp. YR573 TaxID=1881040 RepID=UPI0008BA830A|nr:glycosyltransferase family 4 protein [Chitinophaga sp. YR573]SEW14547.1 Glycosyltransferase involved in cell wall bisynthesis [Chitinophaga sp. YR573]